MTALTPMTAPTKPLGSVAAVVAIVSLIVAGCAKPVEKAEVARPARVMTVKPAVNQDQLLFAGEVRPRYEIDLSFRTGGKLLERKADMGAEVRKGQALARLDPQDARLSAAAAMAQVAVTDADLAFAKAELERNRQLLDQKFISQAAYDTKLSAYRVASAKRDAAIAQSQVSGNQAAYTTLVADSAGVITAVLAEAGQVVSAGQPVMKLARTEERDVWINVAESQAAGLQPGVPARISLWSQPQKIYAGMVREVAPSADALTRTYTVKVSIQNADDALRWGMTANVGVAGIRNGAVAAGAIVVPLTALNQQGQQASVWVVGPANAVQSRPVQVAQYLENGAVIASGLKEGEMIIVAGVHKLNAGEVIRPLPEPGLAVAPSSPEAPSLAHNAADAKPASSSPASVAPAASRPPGR